MNRIGNKHHRCLTHLPVFSLLVSPLPSFCLTLWSMYNLLTNLLSQQLITVTFRIYIYLVQLPWSNAFCQYMNQVQNSSSMSKVHFDIILGIPVASLVSFPLPNQNWSSPSTYSILLSNLLLRIIATILAVCAMMLTLWWSLHFVACSFLFKAITATSAKFLGHYSVSYTLLFSCVTVLRPPSPNSFNKSPSISLFF